MYRFKPLAVFLLIAALPMGCGDQINAPNPLTDSTSLLSSQAIVTALTVSPSGDLTGVTDYANIKNALEAAKNGGAVELAAGTFYLHKSIVVSEFSGTFKGAGKALTTVQTAPGVDFDLTEACDLFRSLSASLSASMFLFPFTPSSEAKTFRMSDMKIVINERGVDPPEVGFAHYGQPPPAAILNTMAAVGVVNVDGLGPLHGEPIQAHHTTNLDVSVEHMVIEGVQDPKFVGLFDDYYYDRNNSILCGICLWTITVGSRPTVKDVHVVNADIGFNLSINPAGPLAEGNSIEQSIYGVENQYSPNSIVSNNEISDGYLSVVLNRSPNSLIEANSISCDDYSSLAIYNSNSPNSLIEANSVSGNGYVPIIPNASSNTDIIDNFVTGNWAYGINPYNGSDGCTITGNHLGETKDGQRPGMVTAYGAIAVEVSDHCTVKHNKFLNVGSFFSLGYGAVLALDANGNTIKNNDYTESGLPGWDFGMGAVLLFFGTSGNKVSESVSPAGTTFPLGTTLCDQIFDLGLNKVSGYEVCEHNWERFTQLAEDLATKLAEKNERMLDIHNGWFKE